MINRHTAAAAHVLLSVLLMEFRDFDHQTRDDPDMRALAGARAGFVRALMAAAAECRLMVLVDACGELDVDAEGVVPPLIGREVAAMARRMGVNP